MNESVNKKDIAAAIAEASGETKVLCETMVDYVVDTIAATVASGTDVSLHGLGKFTVTERAARTARNPRTGKSVKVPAKKALKFKPSKTVKDMLNQ